MKKRKYYIRTVLLLIVLILLFRMVPALPWWTFLIPVIICGAVITWLRWQVHTFLTGFFAGFVIWLGAHLCFQLQYNGDILGRFGTLPEILLLFASGCIGGLLTGLALYTGRTIVYPKKETL